MQNAKIVLATSLSPIDGRDVQPTAIQSWLDLGATVLAINSKDEIEALAPSFPSVRFIPTSRTAEQHAKRPVPFIFDLLQAVKAHSEPGDTVGIINADIFLRPLPGLFDFLTEQSKGSLILGPRVDVEDKTEFSGFTSPHEPTFSVGYDYFVMDRDLIDDFADNPFAMGMPFWDYWLPLTAYLAGRNLKALKSPVALHAKHETRWDDTIYLFFHALVAYALEQSKVNDQTTDPTLRRLSFFLNALSHHYGFVLNSGTAEQGDSLDDGALTALADFYDRFQETAVHTIKSNAETIRFSPA